ncbi:hypothetical protein [Peribacillus loiseleuriae]|uniref:hypothetical protein n=1 Tax=Peribacillus loiseleuriae TaxID=1679170 RepID=UPI003CFDA5A9
MTPKELLIEELQQVSESAIRAELWLHGLMPKEIISKEILINTLVALYFED